MPRNRLEAFSDGVIAIVITLLVLEIHVPQTGAGISNAEMMRVLFRLAPSFVVYAISFAVCAVWWVSHHNFVHDLEQVDRALLWYNNLFLLWLAFLPFPTALLGQDPEQPLAAALYGIVGALTGFSFWLMRFHASRHPKLMKASITPAQRARRVRTSTLSPLLYALGTLSSLVFPVAGLCIYAAVPTYFAFANMAGPGDGGAREDDSQ
jgi:uncharacterized membrane protein